MIQFISEVSHFEEDDTQNYLVFPQIKGCFKVITGAGIGSRYIYYWESKGLSNERINCIKTSDYGITPYLSYWDITNYWGCLNQDQGIIPFKGIVTIYIVH